MNIKIDTKEKFRVITPEITELSANMTEELMKALEFSTEFSSQNAILSLRNVQKANESIAELILNAQKEYYDKGHSFVICEIPDDICHYFEDSINKTPTESEAWDIVQMEEIERELFKDFED